LVVNRNPQQILSFPVASWWVGRALLQWRVSWSGAAFDGAAHQVLKELHEVSLKEKGSLRSQASLLAASLALSGLLATASSGTDMRLAQYSSKLLNLTDLHTTLCEAMCQVRRKLRKGDRGTVLDLRHCH
jgi:hypothetical protein